MPPFTDLPGTSSHNIQQVIYLMFEGDGQAK